MIDLVDLIRSSSKLPISAWLPKVLRGMMRADMNLEGFIHQVAEASPHEIVRSVAFLEVEFPPDESDEDRAPWDKTPNGATVGTLLQAAARRHGATSSPVIVASLRRNHLDHHVDDYLHEIATWAPTVWIIGILSDFRDAALYNDVSRLLRIIGADRGVDDLIPLLHELRQRNLTGEVSVILRSAASKSAFRFTHVANELTANGAPEELLAEMIWGIPDGHHEEYAEDLIRVDMQEIATRVRASADDPPF
ncbi:hypothetical protein ACWDXD_21785 [Streptomyces sp. NPDC003314]